MPRIERRTFLIGTLAAAGGLALGYRAWSGSFDAQAAMLVSREGESLLGGWIKVGTDDLVTVYIPHVDMGQGVHTALAMLAAEELDADFARVRPERAPAEKAFANRFLAEGWVLRDLKVPRILDGAVDITFAEAARFLDLQVTGGSTAVRFTGQAGMRVVGAAARAMLAEAAARRWGVPAGQVSVSNGIVSHAASGRSARFGELAADAARLGVPASPRLKDRKAFRIVGTSPPRFDIPAKVRGAAGYGIDVELPGMLYAAVKAAPVHGGRLVAVDPAPALALPGVERVVRLERAVAVVAGSWWQARRALAALAPQFSDGGNGAASSASLYARQDQALASGRGASVESTGDAEAALRRAPPGRIVEATYRVPFLHHAAMEPINATAQYKDGRLTVWAGEQDGLGAKANLVKWTGLAAAAVTLVPLPVGGSFGRRSNLSNGYLEPIARIAMALAPRPVKTIWSREEDFAQGTYRPALTTHIRAALGPDGRPLAWSQATVDDPGADSRTDAHSIPYLVPNRAMRSCAAPAHVRTGIWRSVEHSQHGFYTECFIDELAHAAGRDPCEYRRDLLPPGSRHRRALEAAAARSGWGEPLPPGVGRGIAVVESFGTAVAHVIEASLGPAGIPRVHRVTAAVDCGTVCHPDTAAAQIEGAIVMGLSAAIAEEITVDAGAVVQMNFPDYPLLTLAQTPRIDVHFLSSDGPWGGLGEPGLPPVAPALANAIFAATGQRLRTLPLAAAARKLAAG
jgi:isoquinoline 1-oxidoreductase beta subunit